MSSSKIYSTLDFVSLIFIARGFRLGLRKPTLSKRNLTKTHAKSLLFTFPSYTLLSYPHSYPTHFSILHIFLSHLLFSPTHFSTLSTCLSHPLFYSIHFSITSTFLSIYFSIPLSCPSRTYFSVPPTFLSHPLFLSYPLFYPTHFSIPPPRFPVVTLFHSPLKKSMVQIPPYILHHV